MNSCNYLTNGAPTNGVAIVGAGIAGLHLGLLLLAHDIPVTIYSDRTPDQLRQSRLPSTVALMGATRTRHRALGIHDWDAPEFDTVHAHFYVGGEQPFGFIGQPTEPFLLIDMRLYLPHLLETFTARGGQVIVRDLQANHMTELATQAALVVVATGRNGLTQLFPRIPEASPYTQPQRLLMAGLFRGIQPLTPQTICFQIVPGQGEIFENRFLTQSSRLGGLLIEAIPGSELAVMATLNYNEAPARFEATLLALLQQYAPLIYARIDPAAFALHQPLDLLQGAVTPTVRRAYAALGNKRFVLALGDTHVTHDPIVGQGANSASQSAWIMGEAIVEAFDRGVCFDRVFCRQVEQRLWAYLEPVTAWSNAMLQPPPPHVIDLLIAASQHQAIANAFADNFNAPARNWEIFSSPTRMATFLQQFGWTAQPALVAA